MDDFEQELKVGFLDEALQSATEVETCFLELEKDPNGEEKRDSHQRRGGPASLRADRQRHSRL